MTLRLVILLILWLISSPADSLSVAAVGDIMMGSDYPYPRLLPDSGRMLFSEAKEVLKKANIAFGNLEGTLCDGGKCAKDLEKGYYFAFRTPTYFGMNLKKAGFDIMNLANNHSHDFGSYGVKSTKETLDSLGIRYIDCEGNVAVFEKDSLKVCFIGFYYGSCQNSLLDIKRAKAKVGSLSKLYDIVVVSFHGGKEGNRAIHVSSGPEYYYGENRGNLKEFSHATIDAGADLILGHGPHVPRGLEVYKDRLIAYSLGNFCTYRGINIKRFCGFAPVLWVNLDEEGKFLSGRIYSFIQRGFGPKVDREAKAFRLMKRLSLDDFPKTTPVFDSSGVILPKGR